MESVDSDATVVSRSMRSRIAAGLILLTISSCSFAQAQHATQFSPWYGDALRGVLELEPQDIVQLERKLGQNADDFPTRLKLMAYYDRADRIGHPEDLAKRIRNAFWIIEHAPESEILHSYVSQFSTGQLTPAQQQSAEALWRSATKAHPHNAAIQWNAASFFQPLNAALYLKYLEATAAADFNHPFALLPLAHLYALSVLGSGPLRPRAEAGLEASNNVWVLGNAAHMFQSQYNLSVQRGSPDHRAAQLAERYFLRAKALNASLDRNAILPQITVQAKTNAQQTTDHAEARLDQAVKNIGRFSAEAFPTLPPTVANVLRARNCKVPQPAGDRAPRNVIRGEFFAKGQLGWAVLCSVDNSTTLLAFRNDRDSNPDVLDSGQDSNYLQGDAGGAMVYSRQITAVTRGVIVMHYRAYGGTEPPPIDHHGIDDAFLGKASVTHYFYKGKWLRLQGAD